MERSEGESAPIGVNMSEYIDKGFAVLNVRNGKWYGEDDDGLPFWTGDISEAFLFRWLFEARHASQSCVGKETSVKQVQITITWQELDDSQN